MEHLSANALAWKCMMARPKYTVTGRVDRGGSSTYGELLGRFDDLAEAKAVAEANGIDGVVRMTHGGELVHGIEWPTWGTMVSAVVAYAAPHGIDREDAEELPYAELRAMYAASPCCPSPNMGPDCRCLSCGTDGAA